MRHITKPVWLVGALAVLLSSAPAGTQSADLPMRTEDNLVVASYNIQWLGQKPHDLAALAQVIQHFDVCGVVEVKREAAVRDLTRALEDLTGKDWGYCYGVRTHRPGGDYHEAYAAVWRRDRVELGDGLVSGTWDRNEVFRNDPFLVSFRRGNFDFTLMLVHTRWTNDAEGSRAKEVRTLGEQVAWYRTFLPERDLLVAGDFNYPGTRAEMREMAELGSLQQVDLDEKSTFKADLTGYASSYDHLYVSRGLTTEFLAGRCRVLDSTRLVYGDSQPGSMARSKEELSDHLPIWAEFRVDGADDD